MIPFILIRTHTHQSTLTFRYFTVIAVAAAAFFFFFATAIRNKFPKTAKNTMDKKEL